MKNPEMRTKTLVRAALLLAIGMVLPFLTAQNPDLGNALLPMHFPVMLCGYLCGGWYGLAVGAILPFLRSVCFGMPSPMYPRAVWMAVELACYGAVTGFLYNGFFEQFRKKLWWLYTSLLSAIVVGRILYGIVKWALLLESKNPLTFGVFVSGAVVEAIPGIVLQLVLVPVIVKAIETWESRSV